VTVTPATASSGGAASPNTSELSLPLSPRSSGIQLRQPPQLAFGWFVAHPPRSGPYFWPAIPAGYALIPAQFTSASVQSRSGDSAVVKPVPVRSGGDDEAPTRQGLVPMSSAGAAAHSSAMDEDNRKDEKRSSDARAKRKSMASGGSGALAASTTSTRSVDEEGSAAASPVVAGGAGRKRQKQSHAAVTATATAPAPATGSSAATNGTGESDASENASMMVERTGSGGLVPISASAKHVALRAGTRSYNKQR